MTEEMHSYLGSHWFRGAVFEIRQCEVGLTISGSSQASFSKKKMTVSCLVVVVAPELPRSA
jgi:hypothetical protein